MTETAHAPTIVLNGKTHELGGDASALDLVAAVTGRQLREDGAPADGGRLGIADAVDGELIRRRHRPEFGLADGRTVNIVTAVQGGGDDQDPRRCGPGLPAGHGHRRGELAEPPRDGPADLGHRADDRGDATLRLRITRLRVRHAGAPGHPRAAEHRRMLYGP